MRVTNVGGSLTTALLLSAVAWGVRLLRAKNILRPVERPPKPATRVPSKALFGRLQTEAFRFLLDHRPIAFVLVDVRASEEVAESPSSLLGIMASHEIVNVPEKELAAVMRPRGKEWEQRFRLPLPGARQTVVFLSASGASAARCAATAASLGYMRCAVVEGGLAALAASVRLPPPSRLASTLLSRDALAVLLERLGSGLSSLLLLDVRRPDERTLYGAIAGSLSVPVEQLPRALAMGPDEWMRTFRFARPQPQQPLVFISRKDLRGRWAAQLACDAGFSRCLVLERGTSGWRLDAGVNVYDAYSDGEAPPEPQRFLVEAADMSHGEIEMRKLISNGII